MIKFRRSCCYGCRFRGTAGDLSRCLHPDAEREGEALGARLSPDADTIPRPLNVKLNALASLKGFEFPDRFDPIAIDACDGQAGMMMRKTRTRA